VATLEQGDDVSQYAVAPDGAYEAHVKPLRAQSRAVLVFGARMKSEGKHS